MSRVFWHLPIDIPSYKSCRISKVLSLGMLWVARYPKVYVYRHHTKFGCILVTLPRVLILSSRVSYDDEKYLSSRWLITLEKFSWLQEKVPLVSLKGIFSILQNLWYIYSGTICRATYMVCTEACRKLSCALLINNITSTITEGIINLWVVFTV